MGLKKTLDLSPCWNSINRPWLSPPIQLCSATRCQWVLCHGHHGMANIYQYFSKPETEWLKFVCSQWSLDSAVMLYVMWIAVLCAVCVCLQATLRYRNARALQVFDIASATTTQHQRRDADDWRALLQSARRHTST